MSRKQGKSNCRIFPNDNFWDNATPIRQRQSDKTKRQDKDKADKKKTKKVKQRRDKKLKDKE